MNQAACVNRKLIIGVALNGKQKKQFNNYEAAGKKSRNRDPLNRGEVCEDSKTSEGAVNSLLRTFRGRIVEEHFDESFPLNAGGAT
jgi:hypothetical protein